MLVVSYGSWLDSVMEPLSSVVPSVKLRYTFSFLSYERDSDGAPMLKRSPPPR